MGPYFGTVIKVLSSMPTRHISRWSTAVVGYFTSGDFRGFKILNMFDRGSQPTIAEWVV